MVSTPAPGSKGGGRRRGRPAFSKRAISSDGQNSKTSRRTGAAAIVHRHAQDRYPASTMIFAMHFAFSGNRGNARDEPSGDAMRAGRGGKLSRHCA